MRCDRLLASTWANMPTTSFFMVLLQLSFNATLSYHVLPPCARRKACHPAKPEGTGRKGRLFSLAAPAVPFRSGDLFKRAKGPRPVGPAAFFEGAANAERSRDVLCAENLNFLLRRRPGVPAPVPAALICMPPAAQPIRFGMNMERGWKKVTSIKTSTIMA